MGSSVLLRAFSAGELDPGLSVRGDLDVYGTGLKTCRNFLVRRSGGVVSRPGLEHVADCKDEDRTYLMSYVFVASDECYVIEAGHHYFRFHHRLRGMVFELATPYPLDAFTPDGPLAWHQAGPVVIFTHMRYPASELVKGPPGSDTFTLTTIVFGPAIVPPTGVAAATGAVGTAVFSYVVTAVKVDTYEESLPSGPAVSATATMGTPDVPIRVTWTAVPGAVEYKVYRADGVTGTHGYLGTATGITTFDDVGLPMDAAFTPPKPGPTFDAEFLYPGVCAVHQQRRIYAGTGNIRDLVYASRTGLPNNFTNRSPVQDDDAITFRAVCKDLAVIRHVISLGPLVILTDRGEWLVHGDQDGGLTPSSIYPEQVGYVGAGWAKPEIYGERVLFVQARDVTIREFLIGKRTEGISGRDLTPKAAHLFRQTTITSVAFALIPDAVLWCVRSDGTLLGMTYVPDEQVLAWHHHDTDGGLFEQVLVMPEPEEDAVYVIVNRDGVRSLERLGIRDDPTRAPALDQVVRYHAPGVTLSGLAHLAGREVTVVLDGAWREQLRLVVEAAGTLTLPRPAAVVDVGVPITCDLETLNLDATGTDARDKRKKVTALAFEVEDSYQNFYAGPDEGHLLPVVPAPWENPLARISARIELAPTGTFNDNGRVFVRHTEPTTLTVLGVFPTVDIGG